MENTSNATIDNCKISNCFTGIGVVSCNSITIKQGHIHNNTFGIDIDNSKQMDIENIDVFDNDGGIIIHK